MEFKAICLFNISTLGVCAHMGMGQDLVHPKRHGLLPESDLNLAICGFCKS
jgi:hypothetical protein